MKYRGSEASGNSGSPRRRRKFKSLKNYQRIIDEEVDENKRYAGHCFWIWRILLSVLVLAMVVVVMGICKSIHNTVMTFFHEAKTPPLIPPDVAEPQPPSWSELKVFRRGAVCMDAKECALIGRSVLEKNGSAIDAAIASMICNGLINMQSMGFGGGFLMTVYQRVNQEAVTLDARECAPRAADAKIYDDLDPLASQIGPMAIPVPGELAGYWEAHKRFGSLPWADLFQPSIEICENGYKLTKNLRETLAMNSQSVHTDPSLRSWFVDEKTEDFKHLGSIVRPVKLCETMRRVARIGANEFYNGSLGKIFVEDVRKRGSILTEEDLAAYRVKWGKTISTRFSTGETLHTVGPPGSGALLALILNILDGYKLGILSLSTPNSTLTTYQRIIETYKYAYALRTELADPAYVDMSALLRNLTSKSYADDLRRRINDRRTWNDPRHYGATSSGTKGDHGTAHISILSPNGDAVSVTSSLNLYFGSGVVSERTGILTSSSMDDFGVANRESYFGLPASPKNSVEPGKRPLSSMSPTILLDSKNEVRMVVGAAGGTKIPTTLSFVIARHLWIKETIKEAVDAARIHHQLQPMEVAYEYGVPKLIIDGLRGLGHDISRWRDRGSIICAIVKVNGTIFANADYRKGCEVCGLD